MQSCQAEDEDAADEVKSFEVSHKKNVCSHKNPYNKKQTNKKKARARTWLINKQQEVKTKIKTRLIHELAVLSGVLLKWELGSARI